MIGFNYVYVKFPETHTRSENDKFNIGSPKNPVKQI